KQYALQVLHDLEQIHLKGGYRLDAPKPSDLLATATKLKAIEKPDPVMQIERTVAALESHSEKARFSIFRRWIHTAWLFGFAPVLFTSLILPLCVFFTRSKLQLWWIGAAAVWFFTMVLLSTIGRPLDRYLIPAVPVMFWTLSSAVIFLWN